MKLYSSRTGRRASAIRFSPASACSAIEKACSAAGFVNGEYKKGYGLSDDCVDPIFQDKKSEPGALGKCPCDISKVLVSYGTLRQMVGL